MIQKIDPAAAIRLLDAKKAQAVDVREPDEYAMRHIRRLRDEGKLKNEGGVMQPIYVPGNGYYTNNKHVTD